MAKEQDIKKLPSDWKWVKMEEVCEIISGKNQAKIINPNGKYPIYGSSGIFGYADKYICNEGTTIIGRKGTINSPLFVKTKFWNVDTAFGLSPKGNYDNKLLYYFCLSFNFHKLDKSTTIPSLAKRDLLAINLPLPPKSTQQAIVSQIEELFSELDKGIEQLKTAQQQLKTFRLAVLKWAFEGKLTNENVKEGALPDGWKTIELKNLIEKIADGPFGSNLKTSDYVESGVRVIRLENVGQLEFKDAYRTFITNEKYETIKKHTVSNGDIIFSSFITENVRVVILPEHIKKAVNKADCFLVRVSAQKINKKYLVYYFSSRDFYQQLVKEIHGATRPRINTSQLKSTFIPIASIDEQQRIVLEIESRLSVADKMEETIIQSLQQAETLRQSILKMAFEGRLVATDIIETIKKTTKPQINKVSEITL